MIFCVIICVTTGQCLAQAPTRGQLNTIITTVNTTTEKLGIEKLYLQTDKPTYNTGDTLWFKAYLVDASSLSSSLKSGLLYIELASDSNRLVQRMMLPVYRGLTLGSIVLNPDDMPQGGYTLKAYTNWMRNFGEEIIYQKHFYVANPNADNWLINYNANAAKLNGKENVKLKLNINQLDNDPVRVREMQLRLTDGKRTLLKSDVQTDVAGLLDVNFDLPEKANAKNLSVSLKDMRKGAGNRVLNMPLLLNRPQNIDVQFMPEGGNLVAGLAAHVAFKAVSEDGLGINISGTIFDSKNNKVADFSSAHKGMGTFDFLPVANEVYTAKVKLADGTLKNITLPIVAVKGISLTVKNPYKADSCEVWVYGSADSTVINRQYYLIAQARGIACYGASFKLGNRPAKFTMAKNLFPTGVVRFMLVGADKTLLNERLAYIDHADDLRIKISPGKPTYNRRDSVSMNLEVTDKNGAPVLGSFSLAVTDDGQVKIDTLTQSRISTYLHLSSDLSGPIEDPGYYNNPLASAQKWQNMDNLLLTQGWVGYNWNNYFKSAPAFAFQPEREFSIRGKVTNVFNKPVAKSGITLLSKKPFLLADTVSNDKGNFIFTGIYPADTAVFFLQAKNKRGKSFNVGIEVEEFVPPVFKAPAERLVPWYVNIDTARRQLVTKQKQLKDNQERISKGTLLKAVEVKAKKVVKGSKNLNGAGGSDIIIDEETIIKSGRTNLRQLLEKRVKGFYLKTGKNFFRSYVINNVTMHLVIDGVEIDWFFDPEGSVEYFRFYDQYLDYYDAEEIKGIEVMTSSQYSSSYFSQFIQPKNPMASPFDHCFVEVTTRSGHGPFMKKAVGTYVYRPMPFALPKAFYSPKYKPNSVPDMTDIRSTIHWEPNVVTDKNGKATLNFYTADNAGKYSVVVEGTDLQGSVGSNTAVIKVNK
ncbi:hypothetical protein [Mucilaginibacter terrae]|uniref:hypothetical protein n=1 Tax=Mucilaginibacter terrae TaxID=1955052 RepID=UPI0028A25736|nr:hypothetical protein [Mucilaginibacter terrae]